MKPLWLAQRLAYRPISWKISFVRSPAGIREILRSLLCRTCLFFNAPPFVYAAKLPDAAKWAVPARCLDVRFGRPSKSASSVKGKRRKS